MSEEWQKLFEICKAESDDFAHTMMDDNYSKKNDKEDLNPFSAASSDSSLPSFHINPNILKKIENNNAGI